MKKEEENFQCDNYVMLSMLVVMRSRRECGDGEWGDWPRF